MVEDRAMKQKGRNPLRKRILRELSGEWQKYLVIALFLILTIGFVSGMYVANGSMLKATDEAPAKYRREDGHFELYEKADQKMIDALEKAESVTVYRLPFRELEEEIGDIDGGREKLSEQQKKDMSVRVYPVRDKINLANALYGRLPKKNNEIAIDRMHGENAGIKVGDSIRVGGKDYKVSGLVSNTDYTTLFEKSSDMMFDALTFDIGLVTKEAFEQMPGRIHENYAYMHTTKPGNGKRDPAKGGNQEKERADAFVETLAKEAVLSGNQIRNYVPAYANQAIQFAPEDFGHDKAMGGVLLYILIAVLSFVFAITISNTITREATVIGTLRASGYTRLEMIGHYMMSPIVVTLIAAVIGNILGYTVFKKMVSAMYYNSYSLPDYRTVWSSEAFVKTTIIPIILMFVINLIVIAGKMRFSPLAFLRRELKKQRNKRTIYLPSFKFIPRFRLRVILQNLPGYFVLFLGICFVMVMLAMAVGLPDSLDYYKDKAPDMMLAGHQTILKNTHDQTGQLLKTEEKSAEAFSSVTLVHKSEARDEDVEAYGIEENSRYVKSEKMDRLRDNEVLVSDAYSRKYSVNTGDTLKLTRKYTDEKYRFKVAGIYDYQAGIALFMPIDSLRSRFDLDKDEFTGWFSEKPVDDIDEAYVLNEVTARDIEKMTDQLDHSMGSYMLYFQYLCILLSAILIFLLTKLIIERNKNAISMTKILGYTNREIAGIYLTATTWVVIVSDLIAVFIGYQVLKALWKLIITRMEGWFDFIISPIGFIKMFLFVFIGYLIVMVFDYRRIRKVPMDEALKNME